MNEKTGWGVQRASRMRWAICSFALGTLAVWAAMPSSAQRRMKTRKPRERTPAHMPVPDATMPERWLLLDEAGWTILKPSADSQILYVSSSEGDDATAQVHRAGDAAVSDNPMKPAGAIRPFKSIDAAMAKARDKQPDWVLLKRGDTWEGQGISARAGRSKTEPSVVGA